MDKNNVAEKESLIRSLCEQGLRDAGLSDERIENVIDSVTRTTLFLYTKHEVNGNLSYFDFNDKVETAAHLLGVKKTEFLAAAESRPQLFTQCPQYTNEKAEEITQLLGINKEDFVAASMKFSGLICQDPETIYNHARLMRRFNALGIIKPSVDEYFMNRTRSLTLADSNFKLRLVYAHFAGIKNQTDYGLLSRDRIRIEEALVERMGHDPSDKTIDPRVKFSSGKRHHQLVRMAETGLFKNYELAKPQLHETNRLDAA